MPGISVHGGGEATANPAAAATSSGTGSSGTGYTAPVAARGTAGPSSTPTSSKRIGPAMAKRVPSAWYHAATGLWDGSDLNRVRHGEPPHGNVIGRG
jgi:hypothetical protein